MDKQNGKGSGQGGRWASTGTLDNSQLALGICRV